MQKKEIKIDLEDFPAEVRYILKNARVYDSSCSAEMRVLYSDLGYYIKTSKRDKLKKEAEMVRFFAEKNMGPELVSYISSDKDYMITKSANGEDALHYLDKPEVLCESLCNGMKYLHSQSIESVPPSPSMNAYAGLKERELLICDTFIHGDFCLPNVILNNGKFASFIDVGAAGVGDRHIDIFWLLWSLNYNLGTDRYTDYIMELYGKDKIDRSVLKIVAEVESKF